LTDEIKVLGPLDKHEPYEAVPAILQSHTLKPDHHPTRLGLLLKNKRLVWAGLEHDIPITTGFLIELLLWMPYLGQLHWTKAKRLWGAIHAPTLTFWPSKPQGWYLLMGAAAWGGVKTINCAKDAAHNVYFEDVTQAIDPALIPIGAINGRCVDISKSHVAQVFEAIFGYSLALDPTAVEGPIVAKPETNGTHGGCLMIAPLVPQVGYVYQKFIDTVDDNGQCNDLRTPCIGGRPVLVWRKRKQAGQQFSIQNQSAEIHAVEDVFSQIEVAFIKRFNQAMGLDCGGLDILRDRIDGRIYIVDVNKTDVGPLLALSWADKMTSMQRLGDALRAWLLTRIDHRVSAYSGDKFSGLTGAHDRELRQPKH
jgi:hypothetical protein